MARMILGLVRLGKGQVRAATQSRPYSSKSSSSSVHIFPAIW